MEKLVLDVLLKIEIWYWCSNHI